MKLKIVREVKLGSYTESETSNMTCIPCVHVDDIFLKTTYLNSDDVWAYSPSHIKLEIFPSPVSTLESIHVFILLWLPNIITG